MRSLTFGLVFVGCLVAACGSASNGSLFGQPSANACGAAVGCGVPGTGGFGSDSTMDGGAANLGGHSASGGMIGRGGEEASGGTPGAGGSSETGGDIGAGGQGGGAGGNVDTGAHAGAGGDQPVSCPEGDYHAVLTGPYRSTLGTRDVGATIDFSVSASGAATGSFTGPGNAKATVTGAVDCSTGALGAKIENGAYPLGLTTVQFSGSLDGNYDRLAGAFNGMWTVTETGNTNNGGTGPWSTQ